MTVKRWLGAANAVNDLWTISLSGTVISQTYTLTINGKSLAYAASGTDTVNSILTAIVAAWNSLTAPVPPPEFQELTATAFPVAGPFTTIQLKGDVAGNPTLPSVATSGGATFSIANTTPATGPNDFANAQNWSGGVAPVNGDTLVFDNGSVACLFNLSTTLTGITVIVNPGFTGTIGLPLINTNSPTSYAEYRTTSLTLVGGTATINGPALQRFNIAFGANTSTVRIMGTGSRLDRYTPVVLITGGNGSSELDMTKGDAGLAFYLGTTANFPTIKTGFLNNATTDVSLICGPGTTLGTISQNGGNITFQSAATTANLGQAGGSMTIQDGSATTL